MLTARQNWSAHMDTPPQVAASQRGLRASGIQRYAV